MTAPLFLTGATGFLGRHLCKALLAQGYSIKALCRAESDVSALPSEHPQLQIVEGDLLDIFALEDNMQGCVAVIHAAALVSFQAKDRQLLYQTNEEGTANVVNIALELGIKRLVYVSSVAALGRESGSKKPTQLSDNWHHQRALTHYARSKFAAEREVWRAQAEGLSTGVVYPSVMVGPGDWERGGSPGVFHHLAQGSRFYPKGSSGFVDVGDVVKACLYLLASEVEDERILCNAANLSWKDFLQQAATALGVRPPSIGLRPWQSALLWPIAGLQARISGKRAIITRASHLTSQAHFHYDGSSFEESLGTIYRPIEESIMEVAQSLQHIKNPPS